MLISSLLNIPILQTGTTSPTPAAAPDQIIKAGGATYNLTELNYAELDDLVDLFINNGAMYAEILEAIPAANTKRIAAVNQALDEYRAGREAALAAMHRLELEVGGCLPPEVNEPTEMPCLWHKCANHSEPNMLYCDSHFIEASLLAMEFKNFQ